MNIDQNFSLAKVELDNIKWVNPLIEENIGIFGFPWIKEDMVYRRLPISSYDLIEKMNPKANILANNTSGGQIHFWTDSKKLIIHARISSKVFMSGMTAVGQGGFDCYVGSSYEDLKFFNTTRFELNKDEYSFTMFDNEPGKKLIVINFPLYVGVNNLELGLSPDATISKVEDFSLNGRIAIYGTSITQGGCASRPGLTFTNRLSRMMKTEFLNFGFSGNGFGENEVAEILADLKDLRMFIIDYEANAGTNGKLKLTLEDFINTIRAKHKDIPIVVISRIKYLFDDLNPVFGAARALIKDFQKETVNKYNLSGDKNVFFIDGSKLLGDDYHEFTIDIIHPNDLGFWKITESLYPQLTRILETVESKKNV